MRRGAIALGLVLVVAGCGPDEETAAFAGEYREVSAAYEAELAALDTPATDPEAVEEDTDRAALLEVYEDFGTVADDLRDEYAALDPPEEFEPAVDRIVANLDRQTATVDRVVAAAEDEDTEALAVHLEDLAALVTDWVRVNEIVVERLPD